MRPKHAAQEWVDFYKTDAWGDNWGPVRGYSNIWRLKEGDYFLLGATDGAIPPCMPYYFHGILKGQTKRLWVSDAFDEKAYPYQVPFKTMEDLVSVYTRV